MTGLLVMAIYLIALAFLGGFAVGSSPRGKCDAEKKMEAIEKLLMEEKSK